MGSLGLPLGLTSSSRGFLFGLTRVVSLSGCESVAVQDKIDILFEFPCDDPPVLRFFSSPYSNCFSLTWSATT